MAELFKAHLDAGTLDEIRHATNGNFALGTARFAKETERALVGTPCATGKGRSAATDEASAERAGPSSACPP